MTAAVVIAERRSDPVGAASACGGPRNDTNDTGHPRASVKGSQAERGNDSAEGVVKLQVGFGRGWGVAAAVLALCLWSAGVVHADGGDKTNAPDTHNCPSGSVWDSNSGRCVQAHAGVLPDHQLAEYAYALAKAGRYHDALDVLNLLKNHNTPQALNYRGYATRKLGRVDEGIRYYLKSVSLDPHYAKVREYLGEAYVIKGDMGHAEAQLQAINAICGIGCEEYHHLATAIAEGSHFRGSW
jgi:tetratricopeptide (TPR) repeat protein